MPVGYDYEVVRPNVRLLSSRGGSFSSRRGMVCPFNVYRVGSESILILYFVA